VWTWQLTMTGVAWCAKRSPCCGVTCSFCSIHRHLHGCNCTKALQTLWVALSIRLSRVWGHWRSDLLFVSSERCIQVNAMRTSCKGIDCICIKYAITHSTDGFWDLCKVTLANYYF
jgi:hypothetical protein